MLHTVILHSLFHISPVSSIVPFLLERKTLLLKSLYLSEKNRSNTNWFCDRKWKSLELFLPVHLQENGTRNTEWLDIFTTSLQLFWPIKESKVVLNIVLDAAMENSTLFNKYIRKSIDEEVSRHEDSFVPTKISYVSIGKEICETGHDLQQYIMFYADLYSSSEYVGRGSFIP